jgi:hypothetical protein
MALTLSGILEWAIPIGVIVFIFGLFYSKFKNTFDVIGNGIKNIFSKVVGGGKEKAKDAVYEVQYKYG